MVQSDVEDDSKCGFDSCQLSHTEEADRGPEPFRIDGRGLFDQDEGRLAAEVYLGTKDSGPR